MEELDDFQIIALQINNLKKELDEALSNELLSDEDYNKRITKLSYQYAINGFPDECLVMLLNIRGDYFKKVAVSHFIEDNDFYHECSFIFEILSFVDHIPYDILATQASAKA